VVLDLEHLHRLEVDDRDDALDGPCVAVVLRGGAVPDAAPGEAAVGPLRRLEAADGLGVDHHEARIVDPAPGEGGAERRILPAGRGRCARLVGRDARTAGVDGTPVACRAALVERHVELPRGVGVGIERDGGRPAAACRAGVVLVEDRAPEARPRSQPAVAPRRLRDRLDLVRGQRVEGMGRDCGRDAGAWRELAHTGPLRIGSLRLRRRANILGEPQATSLLYPTSQM
jgi:hypothetical protein